MGAARWVVIGTALVAAAIAFHMLMSPSGRSRPVSLSNRGEPDAEARSGQGPNGSGPSGPPQEELDAKSRDAMRDLLRQSAQEEE